MEPRQASERAFTIWEEVEQDWEDAVDDDNRDRQVTVWSRIVQLADWYQRVMPSDLRLNDYFGEGKHGHDGEEQLTPDISTYVHLVAEWSRNTQGSGWR